MAAVPHDNAIDSADRNDRPPLHRSADPHRGERNQCTADQRRRFSSSTNLRNGLLRKTHHSFRTGVSLPATTLVTNIRQCLVSNLQAPRREARRASTTRLCGRPVQTLAGAHPAQILNQVIHDLRSLVQITTLTKIARRLRCIHIAGRTRPPTSRLRVARLLPLVPSAHGAPLLVPNLTAHRTIRHALCSPLTSNGGRGS
jgi:hypothetical protein